MPATLLDDVFDGRRPQGATGERFLRRAVRSAEPVQVIQGHAGAAGADRKAHVSPRGDRGMAEGGGRVEFDVGGCNGDRPTLRHGVPGAHRQIEDQLFDQRRVGHDARRPRPGPDRKLRIGTEHPAQRLAQFGDDGVDIDDPRRQHLPAREREKLLRQQSGAVGGGDDLLEIAAQRALCRQLEQAEIRVVGDRRENVVEIVRHSPGETADSLHLLRLEKLHFEPIVLSLAAPAVQFGPEKGCDLDHEGLLGLPGGRARLDQCVQHS